MTAAVSRAAERVFANTPIIRIFAAAYASNPALQRVLAEAGFRFVGGRCTVLLSGTERSGTAVIMNC